MITWIDYGPAGRHRTKGLYDESLRMDGRREVAFGR
jgi:hypothetical protein